MLIDTHCHLDFSVFDTDRSLVIQRAKSAGVFYFINIGATLESSAASCGLADTYPEVYASVGVHPHDANDFDSKAESQLRELAKKNKVIAIGETGLDYYRTLSNPDNQMQAFAKQIQLAKELDLPLVVHSRQAENEVVRILKTFMPVRAVIHCFSGDENFLKECLECGFYISYTCNLTYKKAQNLRQMLQLTPLDRLMLETDAPYLSPEGFRGKRNEPLQIKLLAEEASKIKDISFAELADKTTQNAKLFFGLQ
ncbi:MAG: TatD family hydrolase [Candidatus Omnitrophica bacterium]|jgi:TatD DNase family protein|nr:TatD family hydrolase [Candidatus Omnitrophota bacterium]MDD5661380.1 TatD family hydrolase [Candidatus Omnitrophota bacterium]